MYHKMEGFRTARIAEAGTKDVPMRNFGDDYKEHEWGNADGWRDVFATDNEAHYVGKPYAWDSTEMLSMGIEKLYTDPVHFAEADPEYFGVVVGLLRGEL